MEPLQTLSKAIGADGNTRVHTQHELARALGGEMLAVQRKLQAYRDVIDVGNEKMPIHRFGELMMDAMWPADGKEDPDAMQRVVHTIETMKDPDARKTCSDLLARFGHMHQMAGLLIRDFELEEASTPTTVQAYLNGNYGKRSGLPYNPKTDVAKAVADLNAPRIELTFTAHPTNTNSMSSMCAQREISRSLHAWRKGGSPDDVEAAFKYFANAPLLPERAGALPGLSVGEEVQTMLYFLNNAYNDLDAVYQGFDHAASERFKNYDPATLRLNLKYHSWGSSGDKDGNANVNADTTLYAVAAHYQQILTRYGEALNDDALDAPELKKWKDKINHAQEVATEIQHAVDDELKAGKHLTAAQFDSLSHTLQQAVTPLDKKAFITDLEKQLPSDRLQNPACLNLIRHVHTFGFSFGTIELRETAEEFTRIVQTLIPDYPSDEVGRRAAINAILEDPKKSREFADRFAALANGAEGKPYSKTDITPIAYHTRKRLELARDFPQTIDNHVLAECQDASNMLELLLLQHAVTNSKGQRATMGIIPLFEDAEPLTNGPNVLRAALANPHYRKHLDAVGTLQEAAPAQQIQLAHSDNARRNGELASRALIYRAHQQLREAMAEINAQSTQPVALQFYEGGSLSDPYRGGMRALSATVNQYNLHDFTKITVQGGDLLNYFNLTNSIRRLLNRNITHSAYRLSSGSLKVMREESLIEALIKSKDEYKELFHSQELNDFCEAIGFAQESKAGNASSRAPKRPDDSTSDKVDVTKLRTISYSEGFQHAGLCPTWVGCSSAIKHLKEAGIDVDNPRAMKLYYKHSPLWKDAVDRMLYGLMRTDMPYLAERSNNHPLMARFEQEYTDAFKLCLESYTGKPLEQLTGGKSLTQAQQHTLLIDEVYPHIKGILHGQNKLITLARSMKKNWLGDGQSEGTLPMRLHNAMDTVLHGRMPLIDDPTYASIYCTNHNVTRKHVAEQGAGLAA